MEGYSVLGLKLRVSGGSGLRAARLRVWRFRRKGSRVPLKGSMYGPSHLGLLVGYHGEPKINLFHNIRVI